MAKQKKEIHKVEMTDGKRAIIQQLFQEYNIESATDLQDALKDLLGSTIKQMMETEMDEHLGYSKSERSDSENAHNGYKTKSGRRIFPPLTRKLSLCMQKHDHQTDFRNHGRYLRFRGFRGIHIRCYRQNPASD